MKETKCRVKTSSCFFWFSVAFLIGILVLIAGCWIKNINTPYYTQTTSYYCGAASAKMILNSEKLGIYVASQDTLYNYIHSHNNSCSTNWASDPQGLSAVLNHYANTHTPPAYFVVSALSNQEDGVKKQAYTIDKYGVPPTSLIYNCAHWVVVRGVFTDVQPTTAATYTIYGFYVNDPWYGSTSLGENKYIDISSWKDDYFTGCSWCGSPSGNKYISVVDPDPIPAVRLKYPKVLERKPRIISAKEAQEYAANAIKQFESQKEFHKNFAEALKVMRESKISNPLLVQRSDRKKDAFYIVPLMKANLTSGAIIIDAYSGQLKEATYIIKPIEYVERFEVKRATELFKKNIPTLKIRPELLRELEIKPIKRSSLISTAEAQEPVAELKTFKQLNIKSADVKITKMELVWEPSQETQNPYYPLWKAVGTVKYIKEAKTLGYMNFKGKVFHDIIKADKIKLKGGSLN